MSKLEQNNEVQKVSSPANETRTYLSQSANEKTSSAAAPRNDAVTPRTDVPGLPPLSLHKPFVMIGADQRSVGSSPTTGDTQNRIQTAVGPVRFNPAGGGTPPAERTSVPAIARPATVVSGDASTLAPLRRDPYDAHQGAVQAEVRKQGEPEKQAKSTSAEAIKEKYAQEFAAFKRSITDENYSIEVRRGEGPYQALSRRKAEAEANIAAGKGNAADRKLAAMTDEEVAGEARRIRDRDFAQMKDENGKPRHYYRAGDKTGSMSPQEVTAALAAKRAELIKQAQAELAKATAEPVAKPEVPPAVNKPAEVQPTKQALPAAAPVDANAGKRVGDGDGDGAAATAAATTGNGKLSIEELTRIFNDAGDRLDKDGDQKITRADMGFLNADARITGKDKQLADVLRSNFADFASLDRDPNYAAVAAHTGAPAESASEITKADMAAFETQYKQYAEERAFVAYLEKNFNILAGKDQVISQESLKEAMIKANTLEDRKMIQRIQDDQQQLAEKNDNDNDGTLWFEKNITRKDVTAYSNQLTDSKIGKMVKNIESHLAKG